MNVADAMVSLSDVVRKQYLPSDVTASLLPPMLFTITLEDKPERTSELSGLMFMAISGSAIGKRVQALQA